MGRKKMEESESRGLRMRKTTWKNLDRLARNSKGNSRNTTVYVTRVIEDHIERKKIRGII